MFAAMRWAMIFVAWSQPVQAAMIAAARASDVNMIVFITR